MLLVMVSSGHLLESVHAAHSLASAHWSSPCFPCLLRHLTGATVLLARQLQDQPGWLLTNGADAW